MSDAVEHGVPQHQHAGGENLEVMREAENYNRYLRNLIRKYSSDAESALDFGAGIGTFSGALDLPHEKVHCVEPDEASRRHLAADDYIAYAGLSSVGDECVDYVFSLNVLEHVENDEAAVRSLLRVLRPGGRMLLYVPAFNVLYTSMDAHVGHHRRYRMHELVALLYAAGFAIEKKAYADFLGFFATLIYRVFDKRQPAPLNSRLVRVYDRWVFPLSRLLSVVFARVLGKNLYVVARRPAADAATKGSA